MVDDHAPDGQAGAPRQDGGGVEDEVRRDPLPLGKHLRDHRVDDRGEARLARREHRHEEQQAPIAGRQAAGGDRRRPDQDAPGQDQPPVDPVRQPSERKHRDSREQRGAQPLQAADLGVAEMQARLQLLRQKGEDLAVDHRVEQRYGQDAEGVPGGEGRACLHILVPTLVRRHPTWRRGSRSLCARGQAPTRRARVLRNSFVRVRKPAFPVTPTETSGRASDHGWA